MITLINAPSQDSAGRILKRDHAGGYPASAIVIDKIKTLRRYCKTPGKRTDGLYEITWHRK